MTAPLKAQQQLLSVLSDVDPGLLSDEEISAEMASIGVRWKSLWTEQDRRAKQKEEQDHQNAQVAIDQIIQEFKKPNGPAMRRRI